jgi:hypothetical protein
MKVVLARLLRRTESPGQLLPQPAPLTAALDQCSHSLIFSTVPKQDAESAAKTGPPKRRRKGLRVEGLYLEREPEPARHARALLELIQDECPEKIGGFIPRSHLSRATASYATAKDGKYWVGWPLPGRLER